MVATINGAPEHRINFIELSPISARNAAVAPVFLPGIGEHGLDPICADELSGARRDERELLSISYRYRCGSACNLQVDVHSRQPDERSVPAGDEPAPCPADDAPRPVAQLDWAGVALSLRAQPLSFIPSSMVYNTPRLDSVHALLCLAPVATQTSTLAVLVIILASSRNILAFVGSIGASDHRAHGAARDS